MNLPVVADPLFYLIAVPAVLLLDLRNMATSLVLLPIAPIGVWIGVRLARRVDPLLFYRLQYMGMFLTGVKLVWDAVR